MVRYFIILAFLYFGFGFSTIEKSESYPIIQLQNNIVISPNPAVSVTKVFTKNAALKIKRVEVYSMVNQRVITVNSDFSKSSVELNVFKLKNGKYFVKVFLSDGSEELATLIKID